ncbi:MAG: class II fructose-bisphosphate aldolase [Armatimonadetes bacterium]|nr:class II fructose-bisphosphate aldolase [Armatimonadota bacterium]
MPLLPMHMLLREARAEGRCLAALECWDSTSVRAIAAAAVRTGAAVIFQASPAEYALPGGPEALRALLEWHVERTGISAALHLDHGMKLTEVEECVRAGFTSVMLDGSHFPYEENVRLTRETVEIAHDFDASVEGELGHVAGLEGDISVSEEDALQTDPDQAADFVAQTGLDCLAVAIGTVHGVYRGEPKINLERLEQIAARVDAPLVLHGGSGTPDDLVRECIRRGVAKINICTELQQAWLGGIEDSRKTNSISAPGRFYAPAFEALVQRIIEKIELFRSA